MQLWTHIFFRLYTTTIEKFLHCPYTYLAPQRGRDRGILMEAIQDALSKVATSSRLSL